MFFSHRNGFGIIYLFVINCSYKILLLNISSFSVLKLFQKVKFWSNIVILDTTLPIKYDYIENYGKKIIANPMSFFIVDFLKLNLLI